MTEEHFGSITLPAELQNLFMEVSEHLRYRSRFSLPHHLRSRIDNFVDRQIECGTKVIEKGTIFYRARIGAASSSDLFGQSEMGAPPRGKASSGRINPEGIPYLYLADSPRTAIAEVRPWRQAKISVGMLEITRQLKIVSFCAGDKLSGDVTIDNIETSNTLREMDALINGLVLKTLYFSMPAHSDDRHAYLASQFISDVFKDKGFDGLEYKSVLYDHGINTALFDVTAAVCTEVIGYVVENIDYNYRECV